MPKTSIFQKKEKGFFWWLDKFGTVIAFAVILVIFSLLSPFFFTRSNIFSLLRQISPILVAGLGITFVNMAGESDLSLGGTLGLAVTLFAGFLRAGIAPTPTFFAVIGICMLFGIANGILVAYLRLSSFIVTVATMFIAMGVEVSTYGGFSIWVRHESVLSFADGTFLQIPNLAVVAGVIFGITYIILHQTKFGTHLQSIGENYDTANLMGIPIKRLKFLSFVIANVFYSIAGILLVMRTSGAIVYSGQRLLLPALGVTFVAKTVFGARRPNVFGILVGALILGSINNAFTLIGLEFYLVPIAQGLVLVAAAAVSTLNKRDIQQEILD